MESSSNDKQELLSSEEETDHAYLEVKCSLIQTGEELRSIISELLNKNRLALAMDVKGEHQLDFLLKGLAICGDGENAVYIDLDHTETERKEIIGQLKTHLESVEHPKIFYDLKKAVQLFSKLGIQIEGVESDILIAAHMTDPLSRRYDLDYLLGRKMNMKRKSRESSMNQSRAR